MAYEKDDIVLMEATIEMNLDLKIIDRNGYTFIDLLSDVGGVQAVLVSFMAAWMTLWNYEHFDNTMAA